MWKYQYNTGTTKSVSVPPKSPPPFDDADGSFSEERRDDIETPVVSDDLWKDDDSILLEIKRRNQHRNGLASAG